MREYMLMPHTADTMLVATRLFRRDLDKDFSSALFGYLWNFADPLVIAGVFIVLRSGGIIGGEELMIPFGVYVLYGMLLLKAFTNALARPLTLLKRSASLLTQT
jgi:ABC-type polysaccharide/polyol phosphate export permease